MPTVKNKHSDTVEIDDVYIGRGSIYGNPYAIKSGRSRDDVCDLFAVYWNSNPKLREATKLLRGKNLVCFCSPLRCHGDFLLKKANE